MKVQPRDQNRMAVHSARFLDAIAFELAGASNGVWLTFYRQARGITDKLSSAVDVLAVDAPAQGHNSGLDLSPCREADALALLSGFSGVNGKGFSSLRLITYTLILARANKPRLVTSVGEFARP